MVGLDDLTAEVLLGLDFDLVPNPLLLDLAARLNLVVLKSALLAVETHKDHLLVVGDFGEQQLRHSLKKYVKSFSWAGELSFRGQKDGLDDVANFIRKKF